MATDDLKNVVVSVLKHFETQLAGVAAIDLPGVPFNAGEVDEWFQPRLLGPTAIPSRTGDRIEGWTLNVNCFARVGLDDAGSQRGTIWRALELAGEVRDEFHQSDIAVQDWDAGGDPTLGYLRFEEVSVVPVIDVAETDLQQHAVTVAGVLYIT